MGGAGMTQLAVSVILVGKCVLAALRTVEGDETRRGCRERQWAWSAAEVSSAVLGMVVWKVLMLRWIGRQAGLLGVPLCRIDRQAGR